ncbi:MAG: hypothetical protein P8I29_07825 [Flavobacteriales bacterium]|nr:hypothetical protein [Flavobacteriales bacterium]
MKKLFYLSLITICSICFVSCEKDNTVSHTHEGSCCGTEQCECNHNDNKDNVCAACGMENCTMGCATN